MSESTKIKDLARKLAEDYGIDYDSLPSSKKNTFVISAILVYLDERFKDSEIQTIDVTEKGIIF